jgi:hypothetical protein
MSYYKTRRGAAHHCIKKRKIQGPPPRAKFRTKKNTTGKTKLRLANMQNELL